MKPAIIIRQFKAEDLDECITLFRSSVHSITTDYTPAQLAAWAPENIDKKNWLQRLSDNFSLIAESEKQIAGFSSITATGEIDLLYVNNNFQRQGIAAALVNKLEEHARNEGLSEVMTDASIIAKAFFQTQGYSIEKEWNKEFRGEHFTNYIMKKLL